MRVRSYTSTLLASLTGLYSTKQENMMVIVYSTFTDSKTVKLETSCRVILPLIGQRSLTLLTNVSILGLAN